MKDLQTILDALTNDGAHEEGCPYSNDCFNIDCDYCQPIREMRELNAIAIVKQMMQAKPVAWRVWSPDGTNVYQYTEDGDGEPLFSAPPAAPAWLPISSAPKDGTMFDGWNGDRVVDVTWAHPSYSATGHHAWCVSGYTNGHDWEHDKVNGLTHWMPLPSAPKGAV
jgi:Protein of unknown function (DUF551)